MPVNQQRQRAVPAASGHGPTPGTANTGSQRGAKFVRKLTDSGLMKSIRRVNDGNSRDLRGSRC